MNGAWHKTKSKNGLFRLEELSNRINYLANKNQKTNKNMKTLLEWFRDKPNTEKLDETNSESRNVINQKTFRIKQAKTHKITNQFILNSCMRFQRPENKENISKQRLQSEQSQQETRKMYKIGPETIKSKIERDKISQLPNFMILKPQKKTQQSPRRAKLQFSNLTNMSNDKSMKKLIRENFQTKRTKEKQQQQFKLIEIKKKLLQEEQRSLLQYEKCILYKQKMVQRLKRQQQQTKEQLKVSQRKNSDVRIVGIEQIQ